MSRFVGLFGCLLVLILIISTCSLVDAQWGYGFPGIGVGGFGGFGRFGGYGMGFGPGFGFGRFGYRGGFGGFGYRGFGGPFGGGFFR